MSKYKNVASQKIAVYAYDPTTTAGSDPSKTGDAANITAEISKDGGVSAATNDANPTELDATDHPGIYIFDLTQAETNADMIMISAVSLTANILLDPIQILTIPGDSSALDVSVTKWLGSAPAALSDTDKLQVSLQHGATGVITEDLIAANAIGASELAADAVTEIRDAVTGYSGALDLDANGRVRLVDGTGAGEISLTAGLLDGITGTLNTFDAHDTAQDSQHSTTQSAVSALNDVSTADLAAALDAIHLDHLFAVDYDPATPPGVATALLNEIIESDAGVSRFTVNALENGPSGSGASAASIRAEIDANSTQLALIAGDTGELQVNQGNWLTATGFSTAAALATVDTVVDGIAAAIAALNDVSQADITGGAYTLNTDAIGSVRHVDGTGFGELDTSAGLVQLLAATQASIDAIEADANELQTDDIPGLIAALNDYDPTGQITEDYAADGVLPTRDQAMLAIHQMLMQISYSGTTASAEKFDGVSIAFTATLNDATNPTSILRA